MLSRRREWTLNVEPRRWQIEAENLWREQMRGIAEVVTGGGKTVLAEICILQFLKRYPEGCIIILVPTLSLLDQWYVSLQEDLNVPEDEIATYSGMNRPAIAAKVNLLTLNTARNKISEVACSRDTFLIVDECHRAASPVNAKCLEGNHKATLGLSATPHREHDNGFELTLVPALGEVIFSYDYTHASRDKVITSFDLINVSVEMLPKEKDEYENLTKQIKASLNNINKHDHGDQRLLRLLQRRMAVASGAAMRIPVTLKIAELNQGARTIIFHERISAARKITQLLTERNNNATTYHSRMSSDLRRDNLRLYRRGIFNILVTCRALDEGMNVPETEVAIIASSTASLRQRIQRLGRVLRPAKGKENATIYTLYATKSEENRLTKEALKLADITSTSWMRSTVATNGSLID